jgi:MacB-like periplasmic core domain
MKWLDGARARLRLLFLRRDAESRMNREFQLHIDMEAEHLMRAKGLTADDVKLAVRPLARYRWLTVVGCAAMAFGIAAGVAGFEEALRDGRGLVWLGGLALAFVEADEDPGAPPVIVIGYDLWTRRFSSDPRVIGRIVRLGREQVTLVGVMPKDFVFPAAHALWIPLRDAAGDTARSGGLDLFVFGRLGRDASSAQAQAELNVGGDRTAHDRPTHAQLRPQVVPFSWLTFDPGGIQIALALGNTFLVMLLVLVSANVALLMFARAARDRDRRTECARRRTGPHRVAALRRGARPRLSGRCRRARCGPCRARIVAGDARSGLRPAAPVLDG